MLRQSSTNASLTSRVTSARTHGSALAISTRSLVLAIPALQARAMTQGRDYVSPKDIKALAPLLFSHRLEMVPGYKDPDAVVQDCATPIIEAATRRSLSGAETMRSS